ncbi:MAG: recombinase family protein [Clostridiales bacterium]|nr:recombinase family protein [Clostridiales bacterium]
MNVVIYARYSSHNQTEQSIEGQLRVCKEYAARKGYTIINEYIDRALTGTNAKRPQFLKMIEDSKNKIFEGVLVYQFDRFARNRLDSLLYKKELRENGVRVFSAREEITDDASGILFESFIDGASEYFSKELSQKVVRGQRENAMKCKSNGGNIPLGYKISQEKKYIIDEEKAIIVKKIFSMYLDDYTMKDIIDYLNKMGYTTSLGRPFNKCSIRRILTNDKYIGVYRYNDIVIENGIPPIIDKETFNKVKEKMNINKKAPAREKARVEYLLTTKLFCGTCKEMMTGTSGTSKTQRTYYYYKCNKAKTKQCDRKSVPKEYIEDLVVREARNILTDKNIEKIANSIMKKAEEMENDNNIKILEKQLNKKNIEKKNLIDSLKVCEIDSVRKSIFEEINIIELEYKEIEKEINIIKNEMTYIDKKQIKFFLKSIREGSIEDIKYKRLLINVLIDRVYLYDNNIIIVFSTNETSKKTLKVPTIEELESSFLDACALPNKNQSLKWLIFCLEK